MIAAKHFFAYLPSSEPDPARTAQIRIAFENAGYRCALGSYLLGIIPCDAQSDSFPVGATILHVTPGTGARVDADLRPLPDNAAAASFAFDTVRIFNLISSEQHSLRIDSDPLSLLPYYTANVGHGTLVGSSIRHMFAACPELSQEIDDQGVFEYLCCGTALGGKTLHKHVRLSLAGQMLQWKQGRGLTIDRSGRTKVPPADGGLAASIASDEIAGYIGESLGKLPSPGLLPLTGGFDSRLIACFAAKQKLKPRMVTLGYAKHDEIRVAHAVAQTLGGTTTVFAPPHPDVLDFVPEWLETLEGLADAHTLFMVNLLSLPERDGTPFYHGFIGDTLSGAMLGSIPVESASGPEEIARGLVTHFFRGISPHAGEALQLSASLERAAEDIQGELITGVATHQAVTLWNLENKQRRHVGHQMLYLGRRFMPCPVFYYRPLMERWLSVPRMALDNRILLKYMFERHFPQVSTLPHAEHVPGLIPRSLPAAKYVSGWLARRYGVRLLRKLKFNADKMEAGSYIWQLWHGTTPQQRKTEVQRLEETSQLFHSRLGWTLTSPTNALWPSLTSVEQKQSLMLRRMYLLGEYVQSLPTPASVETRRLRQDATASV